MGDVVRSRLKYALPAAAAAGIAFTLLGGADATSPSADVAVAASPAGLPMLLAPALVLLVLLRGGHLLVGLLVGLASAAGLGLATGQLDPGQLMSIDPESFSAQGLVVDGIERGVGVSVFTLLLMGVVASIEAAGVVARLVARAEARSRSRASAERWSVVAVSLAALLITHATVAILTVGSFTRRLGERFGVGPSRRANLLDVTVCSWPHVFPWFIPAVLTASTTAAGEPYGMPRLSSVEVGLANLHSWALLVMAILAVTVGYGRRDDDPTP